MTRKAVKIHYRKLSDLSIQDGSTLEDSIRQAMSCHYDGAEISCRYHSRITDFDGSSVFVNIYNDSESSIFGDLIMFSKGEMQPLIDASHPTEPIAKMEQLPPPKLKEYINSQMYWYVCGNHVFLIQSMSLKSDSVEKYMTWLLSKRTTTLKNDVGVILEAKFDPAAVGGDLEDIQQVVVGGSIARPVDVPDAKGDEVVVEEADQIQKGGFAGWDKARDILTSLLGGEADVNKILERVPPEAELSVNVSIGFKTKKRKNISRAALKDLEVGLRNLPDSELSVVGKEGRRTSDGQVRLQHPASIKLLTIIENGEERPGSLLDPNDVLRATTEAYNVFLANGKIS